MMSNMRSPSSEYMQGVHSVYELSCCFICLETFDNPKTLDCQHTFCENCLITYHKLYSGAQYEADEACMLCPTCRKLTKIPTNGFCDLQAESTSTKAERVGRKMSVVGEGPMQRCDLCFFKPKFEESEFYCSKCSMNFCSDCKQIHNGHSLFKTHQMIHISTKETITLFCESHNRMPSIYFCLDCNMPNCAICTMQPHAGHKTVGLHDALAMRRDHIKLQLNSLGPKLDRLEHKLKKLSRIYATAVGGKGRASPAVYHLTLPNGLGCNDDRQQLELPLEVLNDTADPLSGSTSVQLCQMQSEQIKKLYDLATKVLEMSQSKRLLACFEDIKMRLQSVLDIEMMKLTDDADTRLKLEMGIHQTPSGSSSTVSISERINSLSSTDSTSSNGEVGIDDHPQRSLLMKPKQLWKTEKHKYDPGELMNPSGIAFLPNGNIVLAEYDITNDKNNRLHIFDSTGKTMQILAQGEIRPLGLAITKEGNIAVTDCLSKRIKVYSVTGQLLSEWGKGQFGWPYGIAINSKNQYVISDAFNDTISIHQPDGKRVKQFGSSGSGSIQFKNPYHIAVDRKDRIIVSDCGNNCIKVFDSNGRFLFRSVETRKYYFDMSIDCKPKKRKLRTPRGVCVDMRGNLLVADDCSRICMFDSNGKYIRNLLTEEDCVKYAENIAVSENGSLAITEYNPNNMFAVKVFTLYE